MQKIESFFFGDDFELAVSRDDSDRKVLTFYKGKKEYAMRTTPTLDLLHLFLRHPNELLSDDFILNTVWPKCDPAIVHKGISYIREAIGDPAHDPIYVQTLHGRGYKFIASVRHEGGGIKAYPTWDIGTYHELMRDVKRGADTDGEDVRIVATGLNESLAEFNIKGLLQRHLRIKILFINQANKALMDARYSARRDKPIPRLFQELNQQIEDARGLAQQFPVGRSNNDNEKDGPMSKKGELDFGFSDLMPCGLVVHTRNWALMGILLAHDSFIAGPMLEMTRGSEPWRALELDWAERWQAHVSTRTLL